MSTAEAAARRARLRTSAAGAVGLAGVGLIGTGLWARKDVQRVLTSERIVGPAGNGRPGVPISTAGGARSMAELIRRNTIEATGGRTYAETDAYLDGDGKPTRDVALALRDERTGGAVENPSHALWIQSTTLQTALMQAYMAFRLAELTVAIGVSFVGVSVGLLAGARRSE